MKRSSTRVIRTVALISTATVMGQPRLVALNHNSSALSMLLNKSGNDKPHIKKA
jgi:hypothetical protein